MNISLRPRTEETAAVYFQKTRNPNIQRVLPQRAKTLDEALEDFHRTQSPDSTSYGRTIWMNGTYVGDIWCYALHSIPEPDAMVSYCIFEPGLWGKGIAGQALAMFLTEISDKFDLKTIGAFTYTANIGSIRVLEKNGFRQKETFVEHGMESAFFLLHTGGRAVLETERLRLRELEEKDLDAMGRILKDPEVMYAYEHGFSDEEVRQWLDRNRQRYAEDGFGLWAVVERKTGDFIGLCGLTWQDWEGRRVLEIGYQLRKDKWHQGFAAEAAAACRRYAFETLGAKEVFSIIRDNNFPSQRVALRTGMALRGTFLKHYFGMDMPHLVFSVKRSGKDRKKN